VGAGKMTRLLLTHLASRGLERMTIVNRSLGSAQALAEQFPDVDITVKLMDDLWDVVGRSDIVYTATSSTDYVIDEQKLEENGLAGGRPLMLVDIAVPRNVNENCKIVRIGGREEWKVCVRACKLWSLVCLTVAVLPSSCLAHTHTHTHHNNNKNRFPMWQPTMWMT
jgi:hypothetical protein